MDVFESYATDTALEENGAEFEMGDATFLIARSGNSKYQRMITQQYEAHKVTLDNKDTEEARKKSEDRAEKIMIDVMAASILVGWSGVVKYKKEDLPFSQANAKKLLAVKDFRAWVNSKSDSFKNFLIKTQEDDEKNLPPTSNGSSAGDPA